MYVERVTIARMWKRFSWPADEAGSGFAARS